MSGLLTLSHAIWFTRSIIKDEFKIRKGATWKKIEFRFGNTAAADFGFKIGFTQSNRAYASQCAFVEITEPHGKCC